MKCWVCRKELEDYVELVFKGLNGMDIGIFLCIDCTYDRLSRFDISDFEVVKEIRWNGSTWRVAIYPDRTDIEELMELIKDRKLFPEKIPIPL